MSEPSDIALSSHAFRRWTLSGTAAFMVTAVLVGRGDVIIQPGDRLTAYAREASVSDLRALLAEGRDEV